MTYDDWKATDDTPEPDPNRCVQCEHPEGHCDCPCCYDHQSEVTLSEVYEALLDLYEAATDAYKYGRIPAEPFVRAGNILARCGDRDEATK